MKEQEIQNESVALNGIEFYHRDIAAVVDTFYRRVEHDPVLKVPFDSVLDWPEHIERMTHFWWTKFGGFPYLDTYYDPVTKHYRAGFNTAFLARWLGLFHEVLRETLSSEQAELWEIISIRMGQGLTMKNDMYKRSVENEQRTAGLGPKSEN